jgi:alpha-tubulin suppressor-like RCC1 family protein
LNNCSIINNKKISYCEYHIVILTSSRKVISWGNEIEGQYNVTDDLENVIEICCCQYHTVALTINGKVICFFNNSRKQCDVPKGLISSTDIYRTSQI